MRARERANPETAGFWLDCLPQIPLTTHFKLTLLLRPPSHSSSPFPSGPEAASHRMAWHASPLLERITLPLDPSTRYCPSFHLARWFRPEKEGKVGSWKSRGSHAADSTCMSNLPLRRTVEMLCPCNVNVDDLLLSFLHLFVRAGWTSCLSAGMAAHRSASPLGCTQNSLGWLILPIHQDPSAMLTSSADLWPDKESVISSSIETPACLVANGWKKPRGEKG